MALGKTTRRAFLGLGAVAAGGLALGWWRLTRPWPNPLEDRLGPGDVAFNPYVLIGADGSITVIAPRAEMGQGVSTTLAALVAEELEVGLDQLRVEHGPPAGAYFNEAMLADSQPFAQWDRSWMAEAARAAAAAAGRTLGLQVTGGSSSTVDAFERMRKAGAAARVMLIAAAAERWGAPAHALRAERGRVIDPASGRALEYGALAEAAARLTPPADPPLKPAGEWRVLGRPARRVDMRAKVTGAPIFGIDVTLPDMLFATVRMAPRPGARARSADLSAARAMAGVRAVVPLDTPMGHGFGVIARDTWTAFRAAAAIEAEWEDTPHPADEEAQFAALARGLEGEGFEMGGAGDAPAAFAAAPPQEVLRAEYRVPFLAHACMEPMNAVAQLAGDRLRIWAPTQAPTLVQEVCGPAVGLSAEDVEVTVTHLGGGFGRRAEADFALYAALLAAHADGRPVKVVWSREEDMTHDAYRPAALARMRAHVRRGEGPLALEMRVAAPPVVKSVLGRTFPSLPAVGPDRPILEGAFDQPGAPLHARFEGVPVDLGVPVGFWRSVGYSFNGFFHQCFMDEIAHAAGLDPIEMRLRMLSGPDFAPARKALEEVARMSGWGEAAPGRGKGVAFTLSFGAWVAQVVEVSARPEGVRVERVWCAADPGLVLDPRNYEAQMASGIVFGLSAAMMQKITFADGAPEQSNFHDFDALRLDRCPQIEVRLLQNAPRMGGGGEPGVPPAAPALGNAIFAATGRRLRSLPFGDEVDFV
ncbi:xanthine dehydrogenase family protein molybdopterin-binding subunit [Oceanicella actignis]|uniref:xanthine dehydrogenase family protein molybdopterin-binding subunit n=1 Tax=Oceanicella actignis TaxID=1189325 RepID=UPI0011E77648|nr:molybdopterin cofactor-binding domain-containing protein [Oceanicella actignis]TYO90180.1 isoquinoline 1-oxidoreductase beta subunit [Oceanicella actignis]